MLNLPILKTSSKAIKREKIVASRPKNINPSLKIDDNENSIVEVEVADKTEALQYSALTNPQKRKYKTYIEKSAVNLKI